MDGVSVKISKVYMTACTNEAMGLSNIKNISHTHYCKELYV